MANYYVDPAATGAADGSSWTDAWTSLQTAADTATAGDTVYCRGTQTLAAAIDFDTNSGSSGSMIKFVGCNAAGSVDGTQFILDGNSTAANCINGDVDFVWLENIKLTNATSHGVTYSTYTTSWVWNNVWVHSNGGYGLYGNNYWRYARMFRCRFSSNSSGGVYRVRGIHFTACSFSGNTSYGINNSTEMFFVGCVFDDSDVAIYGGGNYHVLVNCVFDGNTTGFRDANAYSTINGCRFTNNTTGIDQALGFELPICCYFGGNTTDIGGVSGEYDVPAFDGDTTHVIFGGTDTDDGYVDSASGDFNLDGDTASLFSEAITIP